MSDTSQDDNARHTQTLSAVGALQAHITSQFAPLPEIASLAFAAADAFEAASGCSDASVAVGMDFQRVAQSTDGYEVSFLGGIKIAPTECVELTVRRHFFDMKDMRNSRTSEATKFEALADEWPALRALLLEMIAQCDRLAALYPVLLPTTTPAPAPVAAATAAEPSAPARRGRANPNRRGVSSRSRGG